MLYVMRVVFAALLVMSTVGVGAAGAADPGTTFYPIDPVRAFDSRVSAYPESGTLAPNASRVIPVKDGHNSFGAVTTPDAVPVGATAVSYNLTITQPTGANFVAVTPGDATSFSTSAINFNGTADVANAGIVTIDGDREVKVWNGIESGTVHFIIDITGYYQPNPLLVDVDRGTVGGEDTLTFSGMNVRIVNGTGSTDGPGNGEGNLIVGYNADLVTPGDETRTGSHNLVVGDDHTYTMHSGLVSGTNNTLSGDLAVAIGGEFNTASGERSANIGGAAKLATGKDSFMGGGLSSEARGEGSAVIGGSFNLASGSASFGGGGTTHTARPGTCGFVADTLVSGPC